LQEDDIMSRESNHTNPLQGDRIKGMEKLLTVQELAAILELGESTVRTMAERGELPMFKIGRGWRMRESAFKSWLARKEVEIENLGEVPRKVVHQISVQRKAELGVCGLHKIRSDGFFEIHPPKNSTGQTGAARFTKEGKTK
jgi:excisionase family DNA binding protein